eukprot:7344166-Prorocentrum_lima.AAC.1
MHRRQGLQVSRHVAGRESRALREVAQGRRRFLSTCQSFHQAAKHPAGRERCSAILPSGEDQHERSQRDASRSCA